MEQKYYRTPWDKEKVDYLKQWWEHFGTVPCADHLGLSRAQVIAKANKLKLVLLPKNQRLCVKCKVGFQINRRAGTRCQQCYNEMSRDYYKARAEGIALNRRTFYSTEKVTEEQAAYIRQWYSHLGVAAVSKETGLRYQRIYTFVKNEGIGIAPIGERICRVCRDAKACGGGAGSICKSCYAKKRTVARPDQGKTLARRFCEMLRSAKRRSKVPMDIDLPFLLDLWEKQEGKCAYSGIAFDIDHWGKGPQPKSPSLDQLIPSAGYTKDNVQLICRAVNIAKSNLPMSEFVDMCRAVAKTQG